VVRQKQETFLIFLQKEQLSKKQLFEKALYILGVQFYFFV